MLSISRVAQSNRVINTKRRAIRPVRKTKQSSYAGLDSATLDFNIMYKFRKLPEASQNKLLAMIKADLGAIGVQV